MKLPLFRALTDAEASLTFAVLVLWVAFALLVPVIEQVTSLVAAWADCARNPLCR